MDHCSKVYIHTYQSVKDVGDQALIPRQESGSHFDSKPPDLWQNDTQLYFVRFSVFVESKEILQQFNLQKTIGTLNDVEKHTLFCYDNI